MAPFLARFCFALESGTSEVRREWRWPEAQAIDAHFSSVLAPPPMGALLRYQAPSGLWRQLIDNPAAWEESSASAMFAFAFARGLRLNLLPESGYRGACARAWRGLGGRVGLDGRLSGTCVGTGQSANEAYYLSRPAVTGDLHGEAALLWLAAEAAAIRQAESFRSRFAPSHQRR